MKNRATRHRTDLRPFEHSLPMELLKAREAAMTRFRPMLRNHGLTEQQWRVIRALAHYEEMDAGELARCSLLLAPSLTRILQHLERKNLISRSADASDQRRSVLALTRDGRALFKEVAPDSETLYAEIESEFGNARLKQLYQLLAQFYEAVAPSPAGGEKARPGAD